MVPALTPGFAAPVHLAPLVERLEAAPHGRLRLVVSVPPRHGKTETVMAAVAWWLSREPSLPVMYVSYGARLAYSKSRRMRKLAVAAGVVLSADARAKGEWLTDHEGGLRAAGVGGDVTGHGAGILVVDDPHKNRAEAESGQIRDRIWDFYTSTALTRLEPDGSAIIVQTRWHDDDLAGRALREGYEYVCLPAVRDDGSPLWPERFGRADLDRIREEVGEYDWQSLYMGNPRPRGGRLFADPVLVERHEIPSSGRYAIGVDLAHTAKTRSDYHVAVVMLRDLDGGVWITDVRRSQGPITDTARADRVEPGFARTVRALQIAHPGSRAMQYVGGREDLVLDLLGKLGRDGVAIEARQAAADKWVRAQAFAAAWNAGRVRIPREAPWASDFVRELAEFTGTKGGRDDQVDAAAAAYDALHEGDGLAITPARSAPSALPEAASRWTPAERRRSFRW